MRKLICAMLLAMSAAGAQADTSDAIEAKAEAMRAAWKANPDKPVSFSVPLYERVLTFDVLPGFLPAYENVNGDFYIMQFVPDGETVEDWTQMITITAQAQGVDPMIDHLTQATQMFDTLTGCENGLYTRALGERQVHPDVSAVIVNRGCAKLAPEIFKRGMSLGEQKLALHFRDARDIYTLEYAAREPFKRGARPISDDEVIPLLAHFGAVTLCPDIGPCEGALTLR